MKRSLGTAIRRNSGHSRLEVRTLCCTYDLPGYFTGFAGVESNSQEKMPYMIAAFWNATIAVLRWAGYSNIAFARRYADDALPSRGAEHHDHSAPQAKRVLVSVLLQRKRRGKLLGVQTRFILQAKPGNFGGNGSFFHQPHDVVVQSLHPRTASGLNRHG